MFVLSSINVNGLNDIIKCDTIFHKIRNSRQDIIFLQETHLTDISKNNIVNKTRWPSESFHAVANNSKAGVSILFGENITTNIHSTDICKEGRYIIIDITIEEKRILLVNIYAPSGGNQVKSRRLFFLRMKDKITKFSDVDTVMMGGDFNCTLVNNFDRNREIVYVDRSVPALKDAIAVHCLEDIWRTLHPQTKEYTFRSTIGTSCRLDRFYTSRNSKK